MTSTEALSATGGEEPFTANEISERLKALASELGHIQGADNEEYQTLGHITDDLRDLAGKLPLRASPAATGWNEAVAREAVADALHSHACKWSTSRMAFIPFGKLEGTSRRIWLDKADVCLSAIRASGPSPARADLAADLAAARDLLDSNVSSLGKQLADAGRRIEELEAALKQIVEIGVRTSVNRIGDMYDLRDGWSDIEVVSEEAEIARAALTKDQPNG